jgi:hypothetical protein
VGPEDAVRVRVLDGGDSVELTGRKGVHPTFIAVRAEGVTKGASWIRSTACLALVSVRNIRKRFVREPHGYG